MLIGLGGISWADEEASLELFPAADQTLTTAIVCRLASEPQHLALLDTGSAYSVIDPETVESLEGKGELRRTGRTVGHDSRAGRFNHVEIVEIDVTLPVLSGRNITLPSVPFLTPPAWSRTTVLGVRKLVEILRIGLEPASSPSHTGRLYIGR